MSDSIEVDVGALHAELDDRLRQAAGSEYEQHLRREVENLIHETYREFERAQESAGDSGTVREYDVDGTIEDSDRDE